MTATRRPVKPAPAATSIDLDVTPHTFDGPAALPGKHTIASFGAFKAGDIRKVRHLDEISQMFTLAEKAAESDESDEDVLDVIDAMSISEVAEFFTDWQEAAGVSAPN